MIEVAAVAMCVLCWSLCHNMWDILICLYHLYETVPPRDNIRFCLDSVMEKYLRPEIYLQDSHSENPQRLRILRGWSLSLPESSLSHGVDK